MKDADLSTLIRRVAGGDRDAFRAIYSETAPKLLGLILRIVRDRALAEEVLQEAYLKIWRGAASFDPSLGRPATWLASVAHHAAIDAVRCSDRRRLEWLGEEEDPLHRIADPTGRPGGIETRGALIACLNRLDRETRAMIVLAYCEGWSRQELADQVGKPTGTIKTQLRRGLAALRDCLDP